MVNWISPKTLEESDYVLVWCLVIFDMKPINLVSGGC